MKPRSSIATLAAVFCLVPLVGCGKDRASNPPEAPAEDASAEAPKPEDETEALRKRLAAAAERAEAQAAEERARWTPELTAQVEALLAKDYPTAKDALVAALASPHRRPGHAERDRFRHPVEVMEFFGLRKDMTVVEVGAGAGWWTELLAVVLHRDGKLVLPSYAEDDPDPSRSYFGLRDRLLLETAPALYGRVERFIQPPGETSFGPPQSADMVLVVRMLHNWHRFGAFDANAKAAFEVLRPGGILAVVQHRAPEGGDPDTWAEKGYLPEAYVIDALGRAGFELVAKSEVNANPKDTKDHPEGVWTLPPTLVLGDVDREKYLAIGESDRMTLKFRRPEE